MTTTSQDWADLYAWQLDRASRTPLSRQVYMQVRRAVLSGALRYAFVAAGARWSWLKAPLPRSRRRQTICVVQIVALTTAIVPAIPPGISAPLAAVALAALGASFLIDALWLWRRAA